MYFIIRNLCPLLDGLIVEAEPNDENLELYAVTRLLDRNTIVGDRSIVFNMQAGSLYIGKDFLSQIDNPEEREFDFKNPWGKCLFEVSYLKGNLNIAKAQYETCMQVSVQENIDGHYKTLSSYYFDNDKKEFANTVIEQHLSTNEDSEVENIVFALQHVYENTGVKGKK